MNAQSIYRNHIKTPFQSTYNNIRRTWKFQQGQQGQQRQQGQQGQQGQPKKTVDTENSNKGNKGNKGNNATYIRGKVSAPHPAASSIRKCARKDRRSWRVLHLKKENIYYTEYKISLLGLFFYRKYKVCLINNDFVCWLIWVPATPNRLSNRRFSTKEYTLRSFVLSQKQLQTR